MKFMRKCFSIGFGIVFAIASLASDKYLVNASVEGEKVVVFFPLSEIYSEQRAKQYAAWVERTYPNLKADDVVARWSDDNFNVKLCDEDKELIALISQGDEGVSIDGKFRFRVEGVGSENENNVIAMRLIYSGTFSPDVCATNLYITSISNYKSKIDDLIDQNKYGEASRLNDILEKYIRKSEKDASFDEWSKVVGDYSESLKWPTIIITNSLSCAINVSFNGVSTNILSKSSLSHTYPNSYAPNRSSLQNSIDCKVEGLDYKAEFPLVIKRGQHENPVIVGTDLGDQSAPSPAQKEKDVEKTVADSTISTSKEVLGMEIEDLNFKEKMKHLNEKVDNKPSNNSNVLESAVSEEKVDIPSKEAQGVASKPEVKDSIKKDVVVPVEKKVVEVKPMPPPKWPKFEPFSRLRTIIDKLEKNVIGYSDGTLSDQNKGTLTSFWVVEFWKKAAEHISLCSGCDDCSKYRKPITGNVAYDVFVYYIWGEVKVKRTLEETEQGIRKSLTKAACMNLEIPFPKQEGGLNYESLISKSKDEKTRHEQYLIDLACFHYKRCGKCDDCKKNENRIELIIKSKGGK